MSGECNKCGEHTLECGCSKEKNFDIIKCNICGQVLVSGKGALVFFGPGTSLSCRKCGNTYKFGTPPTGTVPMEE